MTPENHRMTEEMSETVVICTCLFSFSKIWVKNQWKGRLKLGKSSQTWQLDIPEIMKVYSWNNNL